MKIRSITYFYSPDSSKSTLQTLAEDASLRKGTLEALGYEVQTLRLATSPFASWLPREKSSRLAAVQSLEEEARAMGFNYLSIGPADIQDETITELIPDILAATENVFVTAMLADQQQGISLPAVRRAANVIRQATTLTPDGFTNLRFAALANVPGGIPFFPAAYHHGGTPGVALAMECADAAVEAFTAAATPADARTHLLDRLETAAQKLQEGMQLQTQLSPIPFFGFDFSLAPYPDESISLGNALEKLGVAKVGFSGSLAAAAFIADTLDRGSWLRSGFNGLMLPVLEDPILAQRSIDQSLTLKDLLLFSAVCGVGLDTVPLPGDISQEALEGILLDIAALSVRLHKPLTARLMPVPGLLAGKKTHFDFEFFANGAALPVSAQSLSGILAGSASIDLHPRARYQPEWKTKSR